MISVNKTSGPTTIDYGGAEVSSIGTPSAAPLLDEPSTSGDVGLMIATMVIENAFTSRMRAREDRRDATNAMVAAQKDQIAHMREAADERYAAAKVEAWGKIADGALGVLGGAATAGVLGTNADSNKGIGDALASGGRIASGSTALFAAGDKYASDQLDADAKAAENEASQQKRLIEAADDDIKEARDYTRAAIDFLREFQSTRTKSLSSALKG